MKMLSHPILPTDKKEIISLEQIFILPPPHVDLLIDIDLTHSIKTHGTRREVT